MRRVLVTGVTGFAGSHLVDYMLERGDVEIWGIQRWRSRTENIEHLRDSMTAGRVRPARRRVDPRHDRADQARLDLPPRRAVVRADVVEGPDREPDDERPRPAPPLRGLPAPRAQAPHPDRVLERGVRHGARGRAADQGDQPAAPALAVRGQQGRAGHARLPVLHVVRHRRRAHARLQPRGPAARAGVRRLGLRQADRRHRARAEARP